MQQVGSVESRASQATFANRLKENGLDSFACRGCVCDTEASSAANEVSALDRRAATQTNEPTHFRWQTRGQTNNRSRRVQAVAFRGCIRIGIRARHSRVRLWQESAKINVPFSLIPSMLSAGSCNRGEAVALRLRCVSGPKCAILVEFVYSLARQSSPASARGST